MRVPRRLLVLLALLVAVPASPAPLARAERRAVAAVDAAMPGALALLERLVERNSGTLDTAGVRAVGNLIAPELAALGFSTEWRDGRAWGRAGHLVATRRGPRASRAVLLIGHLDTVFEADSPFQRLEKLPDGRWRGPGVADMKGGDVVMLLALRALRAAGALDDWDVRVVLSGDEERVGSPRELARADLVAAARGCDVVIGFEDGAGDPAQALTARRGSVGWTLRTSGRPAHSSQIFRESVGDGAVFEAARFLDGFRDSLAGQPHLSLNTGLLLGGTRVALEPGTARGTASGKANVVPESTLASGDLRALTPRQFADARATMERIVARHRPGTGAEIRFDEGYPPLAPAPGHAALFALFDGASRDLGFGPVTASNPDDAGAADIAWVGELVPAALDGVGLPGPGGHTVQECADPRWLAVNAKRVAVTLMRFARARP